MKYQPSLDVLFHIDLNVLVCYATPESHSNNVSLTNARKNHDYAQKIAIFTHVNAYKNL